MLLQPIFRFAEIIHPIIILIERFDSNGPFCSRELFILMRISDVSIKIIAAAKEGTQTF